MLSTTSYVRIVQRGSSSERSGHCATPSHNAFKSIQVRLFLHRNFLLSIVQSCGSTITSVIYIQSYKHTRTNTNQLCYHSFTTGLFICAIKTVRRTITVPLHGYTVSIVTLESITIQLYKYIIVTWNIQRFIFITIKCQIEHVHAHYSLAFHPMRPDNPVHRCTPSLSEYTNDPCTSIPRRCSSVAWQFWMMYSSSHRRNRRSHSHHRTQMTTLYNVYYHSDSSPARGINTGL